MFLNIRAVTLAILLLLFTGFVSCQLSPKPTFADVPYATLTPTQKLDIYIPPIGNPPYPLIVYIHGGAFMIGDKAQNDTVANFEQILPYGYAVASVNYRLSGEAIFPAAVQDVKTAVRFLRANADKYQLDSFRFASWGDSAGGHLSAMLGATQDVPFLEGSSLGYANYSSSVSATVDWFGPTDFLTMDQEFIGTSCPRTHNDPDSPESRYIGAPIQTRPDLCEQSSPMTYIHRDRPLPPPFFIEHGTADCNIPPVQGTLLADKLWEVVDQERVTLLSLKGEGHGTPGFRTAENIAKVAAFLKQWL